MKLYQDKVFTKKLLSLMLPIAFQQFMLNLVSASDAIMLDIIGQSELSAVALAGQVQFVLSLFIAAVTIGTNTFTAQFFGKKDISSIEKIFAIATAFSVFISAVFTIAAALYPAQIMRLFTNDELLITKGAEYLKIVSPSYLFCGVSQIYMCIMKNCEMATKSSVISSVCVIFDAVMNAVMILGLIGFPKMGIAGAALSTAIARFVEMIWAITALARAKKIKLKVKHITSVDKALLKDYIKYTSPVLGNELVWGVGLTMISVIMGHLGGDAVAANSIASITKNLVVCFCLGLGSGGGIMIGNELGAGNLAKAKEYGKRICRLSVLFGILAGMVILILSPAILHFSLLTDRATEYLKYMLLILSYYMIGKSVNSTVIAGVFCAGGDSKFGFWCDTIVIWGIVVPIGAIFAFILKLPVTTVYFILCLDEFIKLPAVYRHYKKYLWVKDLTNYDNKRENA